MSGIQYNMKQNKKNNDNKKERSFIDRQNSRYAKRERNGTMGPVQLLGSAAGGVLGAGFGPVGMAAGATIGGAIGKGIGWITGSGDYVTSAGASVPSFSKNESTTITHREYIRDIISGSGSPSVFTIDSLPINPGDSTTFPWLSMIAANYEEYELMGLVFQFKSTSGESVASSNTTLGTVIMATQYDPTKANFESKQEMENYFFSQSTKPSQHCMHAVELKKSQSPVKQLYVRTGKAISDPRWTDFGKFFIATQGIQTSGVNLGELWVTYKVKLLKPRLPQTVGLGGQIASGTINYVGSTSSNLFGPSKPLLGPINASVDANTVYFAINPSSEYLIYIAIAGATSVTGIPTLVLSNLVLKNLLNAGASSTLVSDDAGVSDYKTFTFTVGSTNVGGGDAVGSLQLNNVVVTGAGINAVVIVTQLDDTFGR